MTRDTLFRYLWLNPTLGVVSVHALVAFICAAAAALTMGFTPMSPEYMLGTGALVLILVAYGVVVEQTRLRICQIAQTRSNFELHHQYLRDEAMQVFGKKMEDAAVAAAVTAAREYEAQRSQR